MDREKLKKYLLYAQEMESSLYTMYQTICTMDEEIGRLGKHKKFEQPVMHTNAFYELIEGIKAALGGIIIIFGIGIVAVLILEIFFDNHRVHVISLTVGILLELLIILIFVVWIPVSEYLEDKRCYEEKLEEYNNNQYRDEERVKAELELKKTMIHQRKKLSEQYQRTYQSLSEFYSLGVLHSKYQNLVAVSTLFEYLDTGRCAQLEGADGAYDKYEVELRQNLIIGKLDDIVEHLDQIERTQTNLYDVLVEANTRSDQLYRSVLSIEGYTKASVDQSMVAAYNSERIARDANALKWGMIAVSVTN